MLAAVFVVLFLGAVVESRRRKRSESPRVVWGPVPIVNIKYWSDAVRAQGFTSTTVVYGVYSINRELDFDHPHGIGPPVVRPYLTFLWTLRNADVVSFFFDGGFLAGTPLRWLECQLLRLAGKRIVLIPYGSDIADPAHLGPLRDAMLHTYPHLAERAERTRRRVDYFVRWGDFVIRTPQPGYLPRWDATWSTSLAIDTDAWYPTDPSEREDVVVVHSSNHRAFKATDDLVAAVEALRATGAPLRLELLEHVPNEVVRHAIGAADIVADQFLAGYGLAAVEAMSCGRPVLSNLSWLGAERDAFGALADCPIVDTDRDEIADRLSALVHDSALRERLGRAGRQYVLDRHSLEAVGRVWAQIFTHVWSGSSRPTDASVGGPGAW